MGLLSNDRLALEPLKPIVLRGSPDEDASYVFTSQATISLSKPEKISSIVVSLVSSSFVYFPEGIGARASRTTFENSLGKQTLVLLKEKTTFEAGVHTFPFTFIVPNSLVDTIEDEYGRVRHVVELQVGRSSKTSILNPWRLSKPVLVLRTFLSNSLLLNHSVQDLSHTFDRHLSSADVTIMVDVAVFSPGDLFTILFTIQPLQKHVRLESIEANVTESRRYSVPSLGAWRTTSDTFPLQYLYATPLIDSSLSLCSTAMNNMATIFNNSNKQEAGLDLTDTYAYRITFATPTCKNNIHHTTHFEDILFRHRLDIQLTLSYLDDDGKSRVFKTSTNTTSSSSAVISKGLSEDRSDTSLCTHTEGTGSPALLPSITTATTTTNIPSTDIASSPTAATSQAWQNVLLKKLKKGKQGGNSRANTGRKYEKMSITTPIHVFDCRLKEDYGSLPSYFETGLAKPRFTTIMPSDITSSTLSLPPSPPKSTLTTKGPKIQIAENNKKGRNERDTLTQHPHTMEDQHQHYAYLCECYTEFCQLMEMGTKSNHSSATDHQATMTLERIPSKPPPDYCVD